jgi:hypothetical protein
MTQFHPDDKSAPAMFERSYNKLMGKLHAANEIQSGLKNIAAMRE